jgi:ribosome biogenesis SPOUT family RNA methylase Rps3
MLTDSVVPLEQISYVDYPELRINKNESTEMPFRYVKGKTGEPIMPEVRVSTCDRSSGAG